MSRRITHTHLRHQLKYPIFTERLLECKWLLQTATHYIFLTNLDFKAHSSKTINFAINIMISINQTYISCFCIRCLILKSTHDHILDKRNHFHLRKYILNYILGNLKKQPFISSIPFIGDGLNVNFPLKLKKP